MAEEPVSLENVNWEALKDRPVERRYPEGMPVVYTNDVVLKASLYDVSLDLGQFEEASTTRLAVNELVRVVMSPQHAQRLARLLTEKVAEYERVFGNIPDGPLTRE